MKQTKILGTGSYLPQRILTNAELEQMVDTSHQWIVERTGIHSRHILDASHSCAWMAEQAGRAALAMAGVEPSELDLILVATATPDQAFPATACTVQQQLGARCAAFDLSAACSGFIYGLHVAKQFIATGAAKKVLLIGSEVLSRLVDWSDRSTCILFGDGAGAVVLGASDEPGILHSSIAADGQFKELLYVNNPQLQAQASAVAIDKAYIQMKGNDVFKVAVRTLSHLVEELLSATGLAQSDIDWLIPHQANIRIIQATAKKMELSMDKVVVTLTSQGNTSGASIPLALDTAVRDGRVQRGQLLLLEAFGAGFTWGGALVRF